jgi:hypothetical protein
MTVLPFEEWKERYIKVAPDLAADLMTIHKIDPDFYIEKIVRQEYEDYLKRCEGNS